MPAGSATVAASRPSELDDADLARVLTHGATRRVWPRSPSRSVLTFDVLLEVGHELSFRPTRCKEVFIIDARLALALDLTWLF